MLAYVALGGLLGTVARYGLQGWLQTRAGMTIFPIGTLLINVVGSQLLGFIVRYATGSTSISPEVRGALTIGFCGGFTTFSTFSAEAIGLIEGGEYARATTYVLLSVALCLLATLAGMTTMKLIATTNGR